MARPRCLSQRFLIKPNSPFHLLSPSSRADNPISLRQQRSLNSKVVSPLSRNTILGDGLLHPRNPTEPNPCVGMVRQQHVSSLGEHLPLLPNILAPSGPSNGHIPPNSIQPPDELLISNNPAQPDCSSLLIHPAKFHPSPGDGPCGDLFAKAAPPITEMPSSHLAQEMNIVIQGSNLSTYLIPLSRSNSPMYLSARFSDQHNWWGLPTQN